MFKVLRVLELRNLEIIYCPSAREAQNLSRALNAIASSVKGMNEEELKESGASIKRTWFHWRILFEMLQKTS